jgi:hypothetical protein
MSKIDITSTAAPLSDGMLQTANPLNATLQVVTDNAGNSSKLLLGTTETQINSTLRIQTDNAEILDIENSSGNRFNINRVTQNINLDFASKPSDITTQVGAIRTAIDGVNLADVIKFQENGQVTLTERVKIESDSTVTTQTSSVIQSSTTNSSLVIAPNGTGALIADIPDGTDVGGNARGQYAIDFQTYRTNANQVASGIFNGILSGQRHRTAGENSVIAGGDSNIASNNNATVGGGTGNTSSGAQSVVSGGQSNNATSSYSTVSGGQSNTASSNTHATVVGGQSNTASGQFSVASGISSVASGNRSAAFNDGSQATAQGSVAFNSSFASGVNSASFGSNGRVNSSNSIIIGIYANGYLYNSFTHGNSDNSTGNKQYTHIISYRDTALTTATTTVLSLDGTGVTNLIIPNGNNRAWNVQVNWVAVVQTITGTATGITVGDVVTSIDLLAFKKIGGISSASAHTSTATKTMVTTPAAYAACAIAFTAGASQEMALTFTGPTFVGGGSVTMRVVARIELTEVAF